VRAIARIRLAPAASREIFEKQLREIPAVLAAWHVTGDVDYEALITCPDLATLGVVLGELRHCCGGELASAELVLNEVTGLTRPHLADHPSSR
jgi:Lrp/AsnC family transcriptional regulator, leucine-responsive regulatory protein